MARGANKVARSEAIPTLEHFRAIRHDVVTVGASVVEIPRTDGAKGMYIQNGHASQTLYLGGGIPQYVWGYAPMKDMIVDDQRKDLQWFVSAGGTNEWYLAQTDGTDPGLTETTYLYYKAPGGSETLATNGTVGSLAAQHNWDWGDGDTLGFNTIYIRTDGAVMPDNSPKDDYEYILSYTFTLTADDTADTGGYELPNTGDFISFTLDGAGKVFAIASGAGTPAKIIEVF